MPAPVVSSCRVCAVGRQEPAWKLVLQALDQHAVARSTLGAWDRQSAYASQKLLVGLVGLVGGHALGEETRTSLLLLWAWLRALAYTPRAPHRGPVSQVRSRIGVPLQLRSGRRARHRTRRTRRRSRMRRRCRTGCSDGHVSVDCLLPHVSQRAQTSTAARTSRNARCQARALGRWRSCGVRGSSWDARRCGEGGRGRRISDGSSEHVDSPMVGASPIAILLLAATGARLVLLLLLLPFRHPTAVTTAVVLATER